MDKIPKNEKSNQNAMLDLWPPARMASWKQNLWSKQGEANSLESWNGGGSTEKHDKQYILGIYRH